MPLKFSNEWKPFADIVAKTFLSAVCICAGVLGVPPGGKNVPSPSGIAPNTGTRKLNSWKLILSLGIVPAHGAGVVCARAGETAITAAASVAAAASAREVRLTSSAPSFRSRRTRPS